VALLVDTTVLIDAERSGCAPDVGDEEVAVSVITVSELLHGSERGAPESRLARKAFAERILAVWEAIPVTTAVARVHAGLWAELESRGAMVDAHDLWIGATALAHGFGVITCDQSFARIPGLRVVTP
jgi:Predicted nucleic acid-binding protein, contains PIN domain